VVVKTFTTIGTTELFENWYKRLFELFESLVLKLLEKLRFTPPT
jgi:hypothetical protein